jgi:ribosomal-protein-alanine N-acetyltransferase
MKNWGRSAISIRPANVGDCDVLSDIHAATFRRGWSEAEFEALLVQPGLHVLIALYRGKFGTLTPAGFIMYRMAADEGEVLSVAVRPDCRRRGIARQLLEEALRHVYREGARSIHLEVEDANVAALGPTAAWNSGKAASGRAIMRRAGRRPPTRLSSRGSFARPRGGATP